MSRIAYFDKELQQLPPQLPLCLLLLPLLHVPRSCPLAFHTFAYHLRGRLGEGVGWQQGVGCCCCLSQPTLARVFLATCSSSSRSRSRSRFRCQGTTRLLEEVASCRSRRRGRGKRLLTISCHFLHFLVHCFRRHFWSAVYPLCLAPPQVLIAAPSDAAVECAVCEGGGAVAGREPSDFWPKPKLNWANKSHSERARKRETDDKQRSV